MAAARQGASVAMLGRVGNDSFGPELINNLKHNGVDTAHVQIDAEAAAGTATIIVGRMGRTASSFLRKQWPGQPADLNTVSFSDYKLLLLQLEIPRASPRGGETGKEKGASPVESRSGAYTTGRVDCFPDFIVPNEGELSLLTNQPVQDVASAENAARALLTQSAQTVIVTLGANGALIVNREVTKHIPAFQVDVVDTTAARRCLHRRICIGSCCKTNHLEKPSVLDAPAAPGSNKIRRPAIHANQSGSGRIYVVVRRSASTGSTKLAATKYPKLCPPHRS